MQRPYAQTIRSIRIIFSPSRRSIQYEANDLLQTILRRRRDLLFAKARTILRVDVAVCRLCLSLESMGPIEISKLDRLCFTNISKSRPPMTRMFLNSFLDLFEPYDSVLYVAYKKSTRLGSAPIARRALFDFLDFP